MAERDLLHPLATIQLENCHMWSKNVLPTHCAVLHNTVAILDDYETVHVSTDLHSWTSTKTPYDFSSLTTYKSKFVLVGGWHPSTDEVTRQLWTSSTGTDWETSLPAMPTRRYYTSSVSGGSPEVLVVAGGLDSRYDYLDTVEVLIDNHWSTAKYLPTSCIDIRSTYHEGNFYFTAGPNQDNVGYKCSIDDLTASARRETPNSSPVWETIPLLDSTCTILSYSSSLITVDKESTIRGYFSASQTWVETTCEGSTLSKSDKISAAVLSTGELMIANKYGVYKGALAMHSYDPDSKFIPNVLSRLEAVMGIVILSVLANKHSKLIKSSGVSNYVSEQKIPLPNPKTDPVLYVEEVISHWSRGHSHSPPIWRQLLQILQNIGLVDLSQQIEEFMNRGPSTTSKEN